MSKATATIETSVDLYPNEDNHEQLQWLLDNAAEGSVVTLPEGVWPVHSSLSLRKRLAIQGQNATLRLIASGKEACCLFVGNYSGNVKTNGVTVRGVTFEVAGEKSAGLLNCVRVFGDDFTAEQCKFSGAPHEGVVCHGNSQRAKVLNCEADDCGKGNTFYQMPTAAFNVYTPFALVKGCKAKNSGQGYECGGSNVTVTHSTAENCSWGFNVGSHVSGIWKTEIAFCTTINCPTALVMGNGIGRCSENSVHDCIFDGGTVEVSGGMPENKVVDPEIPQGPDTGISHVDRCTFIVRGSHGGIFGTNTGPADGGPVHVLGREKWTFDDNTVLFIGTPDEHGPVGFIAGNQSAPVSMQRLKVFGRDAGPSRGDISVFSNNANKVGTVDLTHSGTAFRKDGTQRPLVVNIEGKQ
jgi:hypothetical protein